jgi:hypothetical protein
MMMITFDDDDDDVVAVTILKHHLLFEQISPLDDMCLSIHSISGLLHNLEVFCSK